VNTAAIIPAAGSTMGGNAMKTKLLAAGLLATAAIGVAGCSTTGTTDTPQDTPSASSTQGSDLPAKDALAAAFEKTGKTTSKQDLAMTGGVAGITGTNSADPTAKKFSSTSQISAAGQNIKSELISINGEIWFKISGQPGLPDKWMHLAADKVPAGSMFDLGSMNATSKYTGDVFTTVERTGPTSFKGTMDAAKAPNMNKSTLDMLGDKAKVMPFEATLDAQGNLATMVLDINAVVPGGGKMTVTYTGVGSPVTIAAPPAAEVVEMPAEMIAALSAGIQ
jgi:hypothetical protein